MTHAHWGVLSTAAPAAGSLTSAVAEQSDGPVGPAHQDSLLSDSLLVILLVVLASVSLVSTLIAFWMYRLRKLFLSEGDARLLSPEALITEAHRLRRDLHDVAGNTTRTQERSHQLFLTLSEAIAGLGREITAMTDTHMALQPKLDDKDKEIKQLRQGYDATILRRFVLRFARLDRHLRDRIDATGSADPLCLQVRDMLEDALAECGIERFHPELGSDYRTADGVADQPDIEPTDDVDKHNTIARIQRAGYRFDSDTSDRVVIPCEVVVYTSTTTVTQEPSCLP